MTYDKLNTLWHRFVYAVGRLAILLRPIGHVVCKWNAYWIRRGLPLTMMSTRLGIPEF